MGIQEFLLIAKYALTLAGIYLGIVCTVYFGYCIYQKKHDRCIHLEIRKFLFVAALTGYIVVVLAATLINRSSSSAAADINLQLFSYYRLAMNSFDIYDWNIIFLNILMFVPLGILLPLCFPKWKKWWLTYGSGLVLSLLIECVQLLTRRGYFEADDIFNNTLGCMLGFGLYCLGGYLYKKTRRKKVSIKNVLVPQIPLFVTMIVLFSIFVSYSVQELGNLSQNYYRIENMSDIEVKSLIALSNQEKNQYVYKRRKYNEMECYQLAKLYFDKKNENIDDTLTKKDEAYIYFYSSDKKIAVSVEWDGGATCVYYAGTEGKKEGLSFQQVRNIVSQTGITIPEEADFYELGDGRYGFEIGCLINGECLCGSMICTIDKNEQIINMNNQIRKVVPYKKFMTISQKQAYELLKEGKYNTDWIMAKSDLFIIQKVECRYVEDSKGFYQPIYVFDIKDVGFVLIPAIK